MQSWFFEWFWNVDLRAKSRSRRRSQSTRLHGHFLPSMVDVLEKRRLLTTLVVNSLADNTTASDGKVTLREAIIAANNDTTTDLGATGSGADTIVFDRSLTLSGPATMTASIVGDASAGQSAFMITSPITIQGTSGQFGVILSGNNAMRLFDVSSSGNLTLDHLTLTSGVAKGGDGVSAYSSAGQGGGGAGLGGAVFNQGTLQLLNSTLSGNSAIGGNGGTVGGGPNSGDGGSSIGAGGYGGGSTSAAGTNGVFGAGGGGGSNSPGQGGSGGSGGFGGGGGGGGHGSSGGAAPGGTGGFGAGDGASGTVSFSGNGGLAGGGAGLGGAIFNAAGTVTITNSTIANNAAQGGSGANGGSAFGGGIFNLNGSVTLANATVASNTVIAGTGGSPTADGGGLYDLGLNGTSVGSASGAVLVANNSLLVNSSGATNDLVNNNVASSSGGNNLLDTGVAPAGFTLTTTGALNLGSLQNNGGPTQTLAVPIGSSAVSGSGPVTNLSSAGIANPAATIISVTSAQTIPVTAGACLITIDSEQMLVTAISTSLNLITVVRGYNGTTAASHGGNAGIFFSVDQRGYSYSGTPDIGAYQHNGTAPGTPTVTSVSPSSGTPSGGTSVTIVGTNLGNATAVYFGSVLATIKSASPTQIVVTAPAQTAGTVDVTVTTVGYLTTATSSADQYTYGPTLAVTAASPLGLGTTTTGTAGTPQTFTISGDSLTNNVVVTPPSGVEVSLDGTTYANSVTITASGTLGNTTVYARIAASALGGNITGNITVASTGATTQNVALSGTVIPSAPNGLGTTPTSPANNNNPSITGSAQSGSTINIYTDSAGTGPIIATGTAIGGTFSIPVTVVDNSSTTFYATATVGAGNTSQVSSGVTYFEDSTAPTAPSGLGTTPASPANNNNPSITGIAEAGSTIRIYTDSAGTGPLIATGTATGGAFSIPVSVADNTSTTYYATATDAVGNTSLVSSGVTYVDVNPPVVDLNGAAAGQDVTTAFLQQTPVLIAPVGTLTEDSAKLTSLTVTLKPRPDGDAVESLSLNTAATTTATGLTVSYAPATGVLSISGTATVATYQSILQGILYNNASGTPTTTNRLITVVATDGPASSATQTVTLTVTIPTFAPVVDLNGGQVGLDLTTAFTEQTPMLIAPSGTVAGGSVANLASLTATVTPRPNGDAFESLSLNSAAVAAASGLTVTYTAATGALSITGSASAATYQTILQGILYNNTSDQPATTNRSITIVAGDVSSSSVPRTVTLTVAAVNDAPVVDLNGVAVGQNVTTIFTAQTPVLIAPLGTIMDVDSATQASLTVTLTTRPDGDAIESLSLNTAASTIAASNRLTVSYTAATGVLSIAGLTSVPTYQSILQGILYNDTSGTPTPTNRSITVIANDGTDPSATQTVTLTVPPANNAPVVDLNGGLSGQDLTTTFIKQTPLLIAPAGTVNDVDSANLASMTVTLTAGPDGDAVESLALNATAAAAASSLTVSYTASSGILLISGSASVGIYQTILQGIVYNDTSFTPTTTNRSITVVASDGTNLSATQTVSVIIYPANTTLTSVLSGATVVTVGSILTGPINTFDVQFSFDMDATSGGANSVTKVGNWALYRYGTKVINPISGITYNAGTRTATVTFTQPLIDGGYQLVALHTIHDTMGQALVGSANGAPAMDFLRNFYVGQFVGGQTDVAPFLSGIESTPASLVGPATTPMTSTLQVFDADSKTWMGATIQITAGYQSDQDVLGFANTNRIMSHWDSMTGTLTLSGLDSLANYRTALQHVTYHNSSASPDTSTTRTISFTANDGLLPGNTVTRSLTVRANGANPTLTGLGGFVTFSRGNSPVAIAPNIATTQPDGLNLTSATVSFTNWLAGDRLTFANLFKLQHTISEDPTNHSAILTLTGNETPAHYAMELSTVSYATVAGNPSSVPRIATFTVTDVLSNIASGTQSINVTHVNQPPLLSAIESSQLAYVANHPEMAAVPITSTLLVSDYDSLTLSGAMVKITTGYQSDANGQDVLSVVSRFGITGSFDPSSGILTLTGAANGSNYRAVLRSVTLSSTGSNVSTNPRGVTFTVLDDHSLSSNPVTRFLQVTNTSNASPTLSGYSGTQAFTKGGATVTIAPSLIVNDTDSSELSSATIVITNWQAGDRLSFGNPFSLQHSIMEDPMTQTATLKFTGESLVANYQTTLQSIGFYNVSGKPGTTARNVSITVNDGFSDSTAVTGQITVALT